MKPKHDIFQVQFAITLYCAWNARDLVSAWQNCSFDRYDWLIMIIWLLPLLFLKHIAKNETASEKTQLLFTGTGLLFSFIGGIGSLNVLEHVALALVIAGWMPCSWVQIIWLLSSISWMPALGWIGTRLFFDHILLVRVLLSITGSCLFSFHLATQRTQDKCK